MATMHCDIVSAEKAIFSGAITMVSLRGSIGELGILPGHAPLLTGIRPGPVQLRLENGEEEVFYASGGFLEVQPGMVTILADTASRAEDIDEGSGGRCQGGGGARAGRTGRGFRFLRRRREACRSGGTATHPRGVAQAATLRIRNPGPAGQDPAAQGSRPFHKDSISTPICETSSIAPLLPRT